MMPEIHGLMICILALSLLSACSPSEPAGSTEPSEATPAAEETAAPNEPTEAVKGESTEASQAARDEVISPAAKPDGATGTQAPGPHPALLAPSLAHEQAADHFKVRFNTTKGDFSVAVTRQWSPRGADRFYNLVRIGYFKDVAFFRVLEGFMAQFGLSGDPQVNTAWQSARIADDPVKESNRRGFISFAMAGPNTRTTQLFINYTDNSRLDSTGFSPIGEVVEGMEVVDSLYAAYGEGAPGGGGPNQSLIRSQGNRYLKKRFPKLDYIKSAHIVD
ncbi:peptidylprolyl isomerase [Acidobacteria bacterium AH-259-A15]|nr:peptidylprolyl isomerase [Acidobacteria bacterium AH-259-A15]